MADLDIELACGRPRVITGFGRSGTTWVQDALAEANSLRTIFEPLNPTIIDKAIPFANSYRAADDQDPALYEFLHKYLCEDFHSFWVDYRIIVRRFYRPAKDWTFSEHVRRRGLHFVNSIGNLRRYRSQRKFSERIAKFVRANMMLGWLKENFSARMVHIVRHPVPVILSQWRSSLSWRPERNLEHYRSDRRLLEALRPEIREMLSGSLSDAGSRALAWCVENSIAMEQAAQHNIPVVYYENLVRFGEREWQRILAALELEEIPSNDLIRRPSQQTSTQKAMNSEVLQKFGSWQERADPNMLREIQLVLDTAGIEFYDVYDAAPRIGSG